jgi:hypothetical protein
MPAPASNAGPWCDKTVLPEKLLHLDDKYDSPFAGHESGLGLQKHHQKATLSARTNRIIKNTPLHHQ